MSNFLRRVIVLNTKGGCGKTTVATNIASVYASAGYKTALIDQDPQGSSIQWLRSRPVNLPAIQGVAMHEASRMPLAGAWQLRIPRDTERVVVDTPAGVRGLDLVGRITAQDWLLFPIQPSAMDIRASSDFIREVLMTAKLRAQDGRMAFIGNRTRPRSAALQVLENFLQSTQIPVLAYLRESQYYANAGERGLGVSELPALQARADRAHWLTIAQWLEADGKGTRALVPEAKPVLAKAAVKPVPAFLTTGWDATRNDDANDPKDFH